MKKRRRLKRRIKKIFKFLLFILIIIIFILIIKKINYKEYIISTAYEDDLIVNLIDNDNLYCILSDTEPNISSDKWVKSINNQCTLIYNNEKNIYIKENNKIVYSSKKNAYFELKNDKEIYLTKNQKYNLFKYFIGNKNKLKISIENKKIVNNEGIYIKANNIGNTKLIIKNKDKIEEINVIVTDLINDRINNSYSNSKEELECEKYSKEENDLLDKILNFRVHNVRYKTRASVVEAARFLTLDFKYKINYFYENGRLGTNKVDAEGRYYHKGLYLDESRYENISGSSTLNNVGAWGCSIYSVPIKDYDNNGLDCSGFVSWALLNGGFDPGDIGAGFTSAKNLTDLGEIKRLNQNVIEDNIKVGDLLHNERNGGHIAILIGIDKNYYYVAQAIWFDEIGVVISKYTKEELENEFPHVVLMDKYYKNDGNLTNMW